MFKHNRRSLIICRGWDETKFFVIYKRKWKINIFARKQIKNPEEV